MSLLAPVAVFVLAVLAYLLRDRRARRRRAGVLAGGTARTRARLGRETGRLAAGRLLLTASTVRWQPRRGGPVVDLTGAEVLSAVAEPGLRQARPDDVLLRLGRGGGGPVRLLLHEGDGALVVRLLGQGEASTEPLVLPELPAARGPWWSWAVLALAGLWLAGWAWLVLGGDTVRATVTGGDGEGYCDVRWTDGDGRVQTAEVDCADEAAGSPRTVWTLARPFRGEAVDPAWTAGSVGGTAAVAAAVGGAGLWFRRRDDDPVVAVEPHGTAGLPPLTEDDLLPTLTPPAAVLARLAPYAVRQLPDDGWQDARRPGGAGRVRLLGQVARALAGPAVALGLVAVLSAPWPYRWYVLQTTDTRLAAATSTGEEVIAGPGPVPDDVTVTWTDTGGARRSADVATTRELPRGAAVTVRHATAKPGWARLDGEGDGLDRGAGLGALGGALALGVGAVRLAGVRRGLRAVRAAREAGPRPVLGLLTADPLGDPVLLVCDPVSVPVQLTAVPLRTPLPTGTAAAFAHAGVVALQARGRLGDGEAVVVEAPTPARSPLEPADAAWQPDVEELLVLLDSAGSLSRYADELDDDQDHRDELDGAGRAT